MLKTASIQESLNVIRGSQVGEGFGAGSGDYNSKRMARPTKFRHGDKIHKPSQEFIDGKESREEITKRNKIGIKLVNEISSKLMRITEGYAEIRVLASKSLSDVLGKESGDIEYKKIVDIERQSDKDRINLFRKLFASIKKVTGK